MNSIIQNLAQTVLGQVMGQNANANPLVNAVLGAVAGNNNAQGQNQAGQNQTAQLLQGVLGMIAPAAGGQAGAQAGSQAGGLNNLLAQFQQSGLQDAVASWVGTGANKAVTGEQIQQALGAEQVQNIAAQAGVEPAQASNLLAQMLPELINQLTPNGAVDNNIVGQLLGALTGANANKAA